MSIVTHTALSRNDAALLSAAAGQPRGCIVLPETMTSLAVKRTIGRFLKHGFIEPREGIGGAAFALTPAGYAAIGMAPPSPRVAAVARGEAAPKMRKREFVLGLLARTEGASLSELIVATGWLPHTTRAALSRLRSAGHILSKSSRADGATAYRIVPEEPTSRGRGPGDAARRKIAKTQGMAA
ncbi:DUF3489 domain-containing protein [Methylobacterium sp. P5_C11]